MCKVDCCIRGTCKRNGEFFTRAVDMAICLSRPDRPSFRAVTALTYPAGGLGDRLTVRSTHTPGNADELPRRSCFNGRKSMPTVARNIVDTLVASGVQRVYGIPGDSLNGFTDALRVNPQLDWVHVRHEEAASFAASGEAALTGQLAVCAGSADPATSTSSTVSTMPSGREFPCWRSPHRSPATRSARTTSRRPTRPSCSANAASTSKTWPLPSRCPSSCASPCARPSRSAASRSSSSPVTSA